MTSPHRASRCPALSLWVVCLASCLNLNLAQAEERYLASNPSGRARLTLIGIVDGTTFTVTDLDTTSAIASDSIDRFQVVEVDATDVFHFQLSSSEPLLAYLGSDCCAIGGSTFIPTDDGHSRIGRAFTLYLPVYGPRADLFVFAIEDSRVSITEPDGTWINGREMRAGGAWRAYPIVGARSYVVRSTGDIAISLSVSNGFSTVPPAQREDSCDNDIGRLFYLATHSWGTGALAVFAYEESEIMVSSLHGSTPLAVDEMEPGSWFLLGELLRGTYRVESTGDVAVWSGDVEGGSMIGDMGDDFSVNLGNHGSDIVVHSQNHGATVFAPYDTTVVNVLGEDHLLDTGEWLDVEAGLATRVTSNQPVVAMTYGGNDLNDWGGYLRPAPPLSTSPEGCPSIDADVPEPPDAGDVGSPDSDTGDRVVDSGVDSGRRTDADGISTDAQPRQADYPRRSCDCAAPGGKTDSTSNDGSRRGWLLRNLLFSW